MMASRVLTVTADQIIGTVILQNTWSSPAPSISAASFRSSGMLWRAARKMTMEYPMFCQICAAMTAGDTVIAFKTPASGGTPLVVSGTEKPTLVSGASVTGGTSLFDGMFVVGGSASEGSEVSLSSYSGGNGGGFGGPGGGGRPGGW